MGKNMSRSKGSFAVTTLLLASVIAAGCSMNQDPFQEKSEQIKQGIPPELDREPPAPKPLASDALRIDALDFYSFKEGVDGEIAISGRVLQANPKFDLSIDNLADFAGATFDATTGTFKWTPPGETTGTEYGVPKRLVVRLTAPSAVGGTIIGTTKAVLVYVTRAESDPEIVSVEDMVRVPVREGEVRKFEVTVKDPDGVDANGLRPHLVAIPAVAGPSDVSGLIYMEAADGSNPNPKQDPVDKKLWKFKMVLDLRTPPDMRGRDFTRIQDRFIFGLKVSSRFGRIGVKNNAEVQIQTEVMKPEISWFGAMEAVAGQENLLQFTVYDPYAEGQLSVSFLTRLDQLPGSAVGRCIPASREGNFVCKISWKPAAGTTGDHSIEIEATNKSKIPGDTNVKREVFLRKINVINVVPPPPAPASPAPAPVPAPAVTVN